MTATLDDYNKRIAHHDGRHTHCRASECTEVATWWWLEDDVTPAEHLAALDVRSTHECSYCLFYAEGDSSRRLSRTFGTETSVAEHALTHPIGDPLDMVMPIDAGVAREVRIEVLP